jgi:hypothetical protein
MYLYRASHSLRIVSHETISDRLRSAAYKKQPRGPTEPVITMAAATILIRLLPDNASTRKANSFSNK